MVSAKKEIKIIIPRQITIIVMTKVVLLITRAASVLPSICLMISPTTDFFAVSRFPFGLW